MTSRNDSARPLDATAPPRSGTRTGRTAPRLRLGLLAVAVIALVSAGLQPATASSKVGQVGLVSFVGKSFARSTNTASLTVTWPSASRAKKYEVYISRNYSMSKAKKYTTSHRKKTITRLTPGANYYLRIRAVNGKKRGAFSSRVGHTTIRQFDVAHGATYRVMSYNVCTRVCSGWAGRQPAALERVAKFRPDVLAAQEADHLAVPANYTEAHYKSGKRLLFRTGRFTMDLPAEEPVVLPSVDTKGRCTPTRTWESKGEVLLGWHGGGCRYAVWAILNDAKTGARTVFVDLHTVSGDNTSRALDRKAEIYELVKQIGVINPEALPVIYAGDVNSHKNRSNDYVRTAFNGAGYFDAYDLALVLYRQHNNSFNDFKTTPKISYKWGDHVDKVWLRADQGRVLKWQNGALIANDKMVKPIPSDHSPIIVDVKIN